MNVDFEWIIEHVLSSLSHCGNKFCLFKNGNSIVNSGKTLTAAVQISAHRFGVNKIVKCTKKTNKTTLPSFCPLYLAMLLNYVHININKTNMKKRQYEGEKRRSGWKRDV